MFSRNRSFILVIFGCTTFITFSIYHLATDPRYYTSSAFGKSHSHSSVVGQSEIPELQEDHPFPWGRTIEEGWDLDKRLLDLGEEGEGVYHLIGYGMNDEGKIK